MAGETNLDILLKSMQPALREGVYVFTSVPQGAAEPAGLHPLMRFNEEEGQTLILTADEAAAHKMPFAYRARMVTLTIHSSLEAVGFLAAMTAHLKAGGVDVNAVSAMKHDHLFVPEDKAATAMEILKKIPELGVRRFEGAFRPMAATLQDKTYVFGILTQGQEAAKKAAMTPAAWGQRQAALAAAKVAMRFHEEEGETLVLPPDEAKALDIPHEYFARKITLPATTPLKAAAALAGVTERLAAGGISVNVISALKHDHLFVPEDRAREAVALLAKGPDAPAVSPLRAGNAPPPQAG